MKSKKLCCIVKPIYKCTRCRARLCYDCGRPWSPTKHFVIDMCRARFTTAELNRGQACYDRREKKQRESKKPMMVLGNCKICKLRKTSKPDRRLV